MDEASAGRHHGSLPSTLIDVRGVSKRYGDQVAIAGVTLSGRAGEVVGIIGPNGAGKTTLLEAICGLVAADAGAILVRGQPLAPSRRREAIFYVPDGVRPYPEQFVSEVLAFFAAVHGRSPDELAEVAGALSLHPVLARRVEALSKGYARRLLLALGLLCTQPVVLMDEPFDGLDLRQTREIIGLLRRQAERGRCLLLSIHQLSDAERVGDRFLLLSDGRVRGEGTLAELRARTKLPDGMLEDVFLALT